MGVFQNLAGTLASFFQIGGPSGPGVNANGAALEVRNAANSAFAVTRGAPPVGANDYVTLGSLPSAGSGSSQGAWFVNDTTGLSTNDGTAAVQGGGNVGPIKFGDWAARIIAAGGVAAGVAMVVSVAANITTMANGTIFVDRIGSTLQIDCTSGVTNIRNGVFSAVTACAPATNVPEQGTDSVGATWTAFISATATTGQRVRNTTAGARFNSSFWPAKDLTGGAGRFSMPIAAPVLASGAFGTALSSIVANDTYALEQLPICQVPWGLTFYVDSFQGFSNAQEAVQIINLAFQNTASKMVLQSNAELGLAFYECDLGSLLVNAPAYSLVNCRTVGYLQNPGGGSFLFGGLNMGKLSVIGFCSLDFRYMCQGGRVDIGAPLGFSCALASVQTYDSATFGAFNVSQGASCLIEAIFGSKEIFGTATASNGIRINSAAIVTTTTSIAGITALGSGGAATALGIGSGNVSKTYGQAPVILSDIAVGTGTLAPSGLVLA